MTSPKRWTITAGKFLTPEQVDSLIKYLKDQRDLTLARRDRIQPVKDYYIVRTLLETGLRVGEFCALSNCDFQGHKLTVRRGKGGKPRTVLLTKATALMLKEWLAVKLVLSFPSDPMAPMFPSRYKTAYSTRGVQKRIKLLFKTVGVPEHLSVHSLRHTYCSLLLASGKVGITTVKENLGHHSIAVTNLYAHAVGDLADVDLYGASSQNTDFSEPHQVLTQKKSNDSVKQFLRKANLK